MAPGDGEQLSEAELRRKAAAGTLTDSEAAQLNRLKGKGAAVPEEPEDADDEAGDEDDEEDEEDEGEEDEDEDDDDEEEEEEKGGSSAVKEPPQKKHKASSSKAGPSKGGDDEGGSDVEIVKGLSGDEVDTSNIIEGGRRTRRGRATAAHKYTKQAAADDSDDEW